MTDPKTDVRPGAADVDVLICTFRRASVADTIASLAKQALPGKTIRIIVADNDEQPTARDVVGTAFAQHGVDGLYLHAPARNISIARNACLDAATAPLAAFIDDDETARPDWLARLIAHRDKTGADIVFGLVEADYPADAPRWMVSSDMHSIRAVVRQGEINSGYTSNVLMRMAAVGQNRFDPALGRSGGEDTVFFYGLHRSGAKLAYCDEAVVGEPVHASRVSLSWLMKRAFRSGQTHAHMMLGEGRGRSALAALSAAKIIYCAGTAVAVVWSPSGWRRSAVRGALHAGVLGAAFGYAPLQLYGGGNA